MRICVAGKDAIAVNALSFLRESFSDYSIVALPNEEDSGINGWQPSLRKFAHSIGVDVVQESDLYFSADLLLICFGCSRRLDPSKFESRRLFKVHYSLLPKYRGFHTAVWPILNGELQSGVSLLHIDSGIDTGAIIDQSEFYIDLDCTATQLYLRYLDCGLQLFKRSFISLLEGSFSPTPQSAYGATFYSESSINAGCLAIDLNGTASQVINQVRAYAFMDYHFPGFKGARLSAAHLIPTRSKGAPGTILAANDKYFEVETLDYNVKLMIEE